MKKLDIEKTSKLYKERNIDSEEDTCIDIALKLYRWNRMEDSEKLKIRKKK